MDKVIAFLIAFGIIGSFIYAVLKLIVTIVQGFRSYKCPECRGKAEEIRRRVISRTKTTRRKTEVNTYRVNGGERRIVSKSGEAPTYAVTCEVTFTVFRSTP